MDNGTRLRLVAALGEAVHGGTVMDVANALPVWHDPEAKREAVKAAEVFLAGVKRS